MLALVVPLCRVFVLPSSCNLETRRKQVVMAFDDVSVPLPPMRSPDIRSIIMEEAEALCVEAGITDITFICSVALHRFIRWAAIHHCVAARPFTTHHV